MTGKTKTAQGQRPYPQLIYWMRVDETPTFDEYWRDPRFVRKLPRIDGPKMLAVGDRTYRHELDSEEWSFEPSMHYVPGAPQGGGGHIVKDPHAAIRGLLKASQFRPLVHLANALIEAGKFPYAHAEG